MANSSAKSLIWSFLEQGSAKLVSLIVQIVLARFLSPEAFGIIAILLVVTNIADSIAQSGLGSAIIQRKESDDNICCTAFWLSLGLALALFAVIVSISPWVESFYEIDGLKLYLNVLGVVVLFNSINSIQRSILQKKMDFKSLFWASFISSVVSGVIGVIAAVVGFGIWSLIIQAIAQSISMCVVMKTRVTWHPRLYFSRVEAKSLIAYGWKIAATSVLNSLYTGLSDLIVGKTCTPAQLGFYSQGRKYPMAVITLATNAIQNVMFPVFARKQDDRIAFKMAVKKALVSGTFVIAPIALFCCAAAKPIVALLLTDKWLPCVPIFQMVCLSHSIMMITLVNLRAYMALGRSDLYFKLQIIKAVIALLAICGTAIATHDIYLTAFATCLSTLFNILFIDAFFAHQLFGYSLFKQIKDIAPSVLLSVVAAFASLFASYPFDSYGVALGIQIAVFWPVYLLGAKVLRLQGLSDCKKLFKETRPNRKVKFH